MLHQYRFIRSSIVTDGMRKHIPCLVPFMTNCLYKTYDAMFGHELAHCVELVHRGQIERLSLQNFGWPINEVGNFATKTANNECRVFAIQYILEEMFTGRINTNDILGINSVDLFIRSPRMWKDSTENYIWVNERSPFERIRDGIREFQPIIKPLLDTTVDYIVDKTGEFA